MPILFTKGKFVLQTVRRITRVRDAPEFGIISYQIPVFEGLHISRENDKLYEGKKTYYAVAEIEYDKEFDEVKWNFISGDRFEGITSKELDDFYEVLNFAKTLFLGGPEEIEGKEVTKEDIENSEEFEKLKRDGKVVLLG